MGFARLLCPYRSLALDWRGLVWTISNTTGFLGFFEGLLENKPYDESPITNPLDKPVRSWVGIVSPGLRASRSRKNQL